jgi:hypothetical protein
MAIPGREIINVGVENQATGSDDLYTAFNKVENNFTTLFDSASPYTSILSGSGINIAASLSNTVTVINTGVTTITAGTGITVSSGNGNVIISVSGTGSGATVAGVTRVAVTSGTLNVTGSPIVSTGTIGVELPIFATTGTFAPGEYIAPTLTVDRYGRITKIASTTSVGTVSSVSMANGDGISISGGPITSTGEFLIKNTGVTRLTAGTGIALSGSTGAITIASVGAATGTVSRVDVVSGNANHITITGSPVTSSGTITVDLPDNVNIVGNLTANKLFSNSIFTATGNVTGGNILTGGIVNATGNVLGGNISTGGALVVTGNATIGNISVGLVTGNITGNLNGKIGLITPDTANFVSVNVSTTLNVATTLNVTGNVTGGNISTDGRITATGNISSSANISGGNVISGGIIYASGNVSGGNITVTGTINAKTTYSNVSAPGLVSGFDVTSSNFMGTAGNFQAGNIVAVGGIQTYGLVYAQSAFYTPLSSLVAPTGVLIIKTTLPTGGVLQAGVDDGTISIDSGNNKLGVWYGGAWHYATLTA